MRMQEDIIKLAVISMEQCDNIGLTKSVTRLD